MNRTTAYLSVACGLALLALVLATPRSAGGASPTPAPSPTPPPIATVTNGSMRLTARLSHPAVQPGTSEIFATVDLSGQELPGAERAPVNLALVIDRSGSMAGRKLVEAKQAARHLVGQLRGSDRLAVLHYGSDVRTLPGMNATDENKARMLEFIDAIDDDGGTNIGDGLSSGSAQVQRARADFKVNRIILISDGQPTEGMTDPGALTRLARTIRGEGISVSAMGVGVDFNESLMAGIAENGAGAYAYLRDASMLATVFQKDLQQAGTTVARGVELSFDLPEGVELAEVLGYRHSRAGRSVRIPMPDFSAGQLERVVVRLRVVAGNPGGTVPVAGLRLAYTDLVSDKPVSTEAKLAATVTEKAEEVAQRRDRDVAVHAARAQAAANLERAADLFARGERKAADQAMAQNAMLFEEAKQVAGPAAVSADVEALKELRSGMAEAEAAPEIQHQIKAAKKKALTDFGRMGSVY